MSLIVGFYENAVFCEINEFLEKPIKGLAKFKWDGKNGHPVQNALLIRKWQIQAIKANFVGKKNAVASMPKINQEFGQIFKSDDKTWHVDSWRFLGK